MHAKVYGLYAVMCEVPVKPSTKLRCVRHLLITKKKKKRVKASQFSNQLQLLKFVLGLLRSIMHSKNCIIVNTDTYA